MSKQARPHSPAGTRLEGPDAGGIYRIIVPSVSRPGRAHELRVLYTGEAVGCTCEGHAAFLDYRATRHTPGTPPARRDCWHMEAAADLLAHHLDPPPADPGGAGRVFAPCHRCPAPRTCARDGCRLLRGADPGFATPLDPDDEGPFAGGAALDAAQASLDGEMDDWLPAALRDHMRRRFDEAVAADGHRWIQSRTEAGVRLTCIACHAVRGWASEGLAAAWLEGGGVCPCGGPTPPAQGAARKPLQDHLDVLYGN